MNVTLVLTPELDAAFRDLVRQPLECAGVLLTRPVRDSSGAIARLIAVEYLPAPADAYLQQTEEALGLTGHAYMGALRKAEQAEAVGLWVHTHPGRDSEALPSCHDRVVDVELAPVFKARSGASSYGSLVLSPSASGYRFSGHISEQAPVAIERLFVIGPRMALRWAVDHPKGDLPAIHDRNIRAFGGDIVRVIDDLQIGIVGAGGHGSAVAEQLVRLGVRKLKIIDPKTISESNPTRVYGSTPADIGKPKVEVLAEHLRRIAHEVRVTPVLGQLSDRSVAEHLNTVDVVFGCTDDDAGRLRLSRFAYSHRTPVIDLGVLIDADGQGAVNGIFGRVTVLHPGAACLLCRDRIDIQTALAQERAVEEQARLAAEGYAPALPGVEPAVVAYTTAVAAAGVNELIERLVSYGPDEPPSEILLRIHDRRISTNVRAPKLGHYCHPGSPIQFGDQDPMWGINWAS